jgi:predicted ABC-type ATPase
LQRMDELAERGESFSLESTLASRTLAPWIARLKKERGYQFRLTYVWLHNPELNIARVHGRVLTGGHHIEDGVVRRRYFRSVANFFDLYCPLADEWEFYDNSSTAGPELIAAGCLAANATIYNRETWHEVQLQYDSRGNKSAD